MKLRFSYRSGFTLVKLLVVIAVIAILAVLLLSTLNGTRDRTKRAVCANNLSQINLGIRLFLDDQNEEPGNPYTTNSLTLINYKELIKNYIGLTGTSSSKDKLFACPADIFLLRFGSQRPGLCGPEFP